MKCVFLICAAVGVAASADAGVLSLEAHEIGTADAQVSNWETDYGSYDRDSYRSKKILVTLHNVSRKPAPFAVTVYFIAKKPVPPSAQGYDSRILFIYDRREHAGEFHKELELKGAFSSRTLAANIAHFQTAPGLDSAQGSEMIGWIAIGYSEGQRFGVAASSQELVQLAEGHGRQSLDGIVADYRKNHPSTLNAADAHFSQPAPTTEMAPRNVASPHGQQQADEFITLIKPVDVKIAYGETKLPVGTRLTVLSRTNTVVNALYMGDTVAIPAAAADRK